jgi:glycosyltransferase involved in cell wall biosynthesis
VSIHCFDVSEKRSGESYDRNARVEAARGRFIAFMDDDELPAETWLASMPDCLKPYGAHVVLRPVYPSLIRRRLRSIRLFTKCLQCARLLTSVLMGLVQVIVKGGSAALFALFDKKRARGSLCTIVGGVAKLLWMQPLRGGQSYGLGATPLDATGGV